jgi:phospholipase C
VFDHTSVIRFLEKRFGVMEPNISAWRRAVCGDLTSCFDFKSPNAAITALPKTLETAKRAATLDKRTTPPTPVTVTPPVQARGARRARALPYACDVALTAGRAAKLDFINRGSSGAVFHVYDLKRPDAAPRRYTVEALKALTGTWPDGAYDLFVVGPNGFHRRYRGEEASVSMSFAAVGRKARLRLSNASGRTQYVTAASGAYQEKIPEIHAAEIPRGEERDFFWDFAPTSGWYDLKVVAGDFEQRLAGRLDDGSPTTSDPAMGGSALIAWS